MSTVTEVVITNDSGKYAIIKENTATLTVKDVIASLTDDFKGGADVSIGIALDSDQSKLLAQSYNVILTPGVKVQLRARVVVSYNITNKQDTDPTTNQYTFDYIPKTQPGYGNNFSLSNLVSAFVSQFALTTGPSYFYGIRLNAPGSPILKQSDPYPGTGFYTLVRTVHYTVQYDTDESKSKVEQDFEFAQDAAIVQNLIPQSATDHIFPKIFLNDGSVNEDNIEQKMLTGQLLQGDYIVRDVHRFLLKVPQNTFADGDPLGNNQYEIYYFASQTPAALVAELGDTNPLSFTAANYALVDSTGKDLSNVLDVMPAGIYTLMRVYQFTVKYPTPGFGSSVTIRGYPEQRVADLFGLPALAPLDDGKASNVMHAFKDADGGALVPMDTKVKNLSALLTGDTLFSYFLSYTGITISWQDKQFSCQVPAGGTWSSVKTLALDYFKLVETSDVHYDVFEEANVHKTYAPGTLPESVTGVTRYVLQKMAKGMVTGVDDADADQTPVSCWLPIAFNADNMALFLNFYKATLGLTIGVSGIDWAHVIAPLGSSKTPLLPWQIVYEVFPTLNFRVNKQVKSNVELITSKYGTSLLGNISIKYTGSQMVDWAKYVFPDMVKDSAGVVWVASTKDVTQIPAFQVINNSDPILSAHSASTTQIYIKEATHVNLYPPQNGTVKAPLDVWLPWDLTFFDVTAYAKTNFGLTNAKYAVYALHDSSKTIYGTQDTLQTAYDQFEVDPLKLQLVPAVLTQVSVDFGPNSTIRLRLMPDTVTMRQVMDEAAAQIMQINGGVQFESTDRTIVDSDLLSKYSVSGATADDPKKAKFVVAIRELVLVVLYDSQSNLILWKAKVSSQLTLAKLEEIYRIKNSVHPSNSFSIATVKEPTLALSRDLFVTSPGLSRDYNPDIDAEKLPSDGLAAVSKIAEFKVTMSKQTVTVAVQNLNNFGPALQISIPAYSSVAELTAQAKTQFGFVDGTFALSNVKDLTVSLKDKDYVMSGETYRLLETSVPRKYIGVHLRYFNRSDDVQNEDKVFAGDMSVEDIDTIEARFDVVSMTQSGAAIPNLSQVKLSSIGTGGELTLFVTEKPAIVVTATYINSTSVYEMPIRSKIADLTAALNITTGAAVLERLTNKQAQMTDYIISFTPPYDFTLTAQVMTRNIEVTYGGVTKGVTVSDGYTVEQTISMAAAAFKITGSYDLTVDGKTALGRSSVPNYQITDKFIMINGTGLGTAAIYAGVGLGAAVYFGFL